MKSRIRTTAELNVLVQGNIIHQSEADWVAKGIDAGYQVDVQIGEEKDGKFPFVMTMTREGDIVKKDSDVKKPDAKIFGLDGKPISTRNERRIQERIDAKKK